VEALSFAAQQRLPPREGVEQSHAARRMKTAENYRPTSLGIVWRSLTSKTRRQHGNRLVALFQAKASKKHLGNP
jgi:hypothetical protein